MIISNWYALTSSAELDSKPLEVKALGLKYALFRDTQGAAVCLSNTCCHRGGTLGKGSVKDGCLTRPYHGWHFNNSGSPENGLNCAKQYVKLKLTKNK